jgi:hypothetical protein
MYVSFFFGHDTGIQISHQPVFHLDFAGGTCCSILQKRVIIRVLFFGAMIRAAAFYKNELLYVVVCSCQNNECTY